LPSVSTPSRFIGDAVVAVFGVPVAHEDDALRATRAAHEMRRRMDELNADFEGQYGARISLRIGVNTGEVVAGTSGAREAIVTGDAVNVAARLEQAAQPGEILLGEATHRLVRHAVTADRLEPLAVKGKAEPLVAYRLAGVESLRPPRAGRLDAPMIGRGEEAAMLAALRDEAAGGYCVLATVTGEPGVGKSRLAAEVVAQAHAFRVITARCLEYGEGITYWPIGEIVRGAAEIRDEHTSPEAVARIEMIVPPTEAAVIAQAIGLGGGKATTRDIAAAVAGFLAAIAGRRPLMLVLDDLHWAEPPLLELVASLPLRVESAPLFVLCLARAELPERDPTWRVTVGLEPLDASATEVLARGLLGGLPLPEGLGGRISDAAAGNPLFVEELIGMLVDDRLLTKAADGWVADPGLAGFAIPATLRELLGARLDALPEGERSSLERGAVEGQVFHRGAVSALSDEVHRPSLGGTLDRLVERDVLRPGRPDFADDSAYRIRHILIRDAAYEAIPKRVRADLHRRFADWLEDKAGGRLTEYEEILGHHLERAHRYLEDLGPIGAHGDGIAARAAEWLERAGRRAFDRRDSRAAANLLGRAAALLPAGSARQLDLLQAAGEELAFMMELEPAERALTEVVAGAQARGDTGSESHGRLWLSLVRFWTDAEYGALEMLDDVDAAAGVFETLADLKGTARTHDWRSFALSQLGRYADSEREAHRALALGRQVGDERFAAEQTWYLAWAAAYGPIPVDAGIASCEALIAGARDDPAVIGHALYALAILHALAGSFDAARDAADRGRVVFDGVGMAFSAWHPHHRAAIDLLSGDAASAEAHLRRAVDVLGLINDYPSASSAASLLAELLVDRGELDEAMAIVERAREWAPKDQPIQAARWRAATARALARLGEDRVALAREAVALADRTDHLVFQGDTLIALADVLRRAGHDPAPAIGDAMARYARKGSLAAAEHARRRLGLG
jgi:tetratricopeptide (TPR) repeat protein